jgi:spore maturation protein SpmB
VLISTLIWYFSTITTEKVNEISTVSANLIIFGIIISFILLALFKKVNVYDSFIDGAKEGFGVAIKIIPYLVAILVAVGVFRESGAMDYVVAGLGKMFALFGANTDFVQSLPVAIMKPLSGSGARGLMVDTMNTYGVDSFVGRLSCIFQGASDTTFYIIAVYFGSIGVKNTRHAISCALIADLFGVLAAIFVAYLFFH